MCKICSLQGLGLKRTREQGRFSEPDPNLHFGFSSQELSYLYLLLHTGLLKIFLKVLFLSLFISSYCFVTYMKYVALFSPFKQGLQVHTALNLPCLLQSQVDFHVFIITFLHYYSILEYDLTWSCVFIHNSVVIPLHIFTYASLLYAVMYMCLIIKTGKNRVEQVFLFLSQFFIFLCDILV